MKIRIGWKKIGFVMALAWTVFFSGCGKDESKTLALITDGNGVEDQSTNQSAWTGLEKYAKETGMTYAYYVPEEISTRGYEEAIEKALKQGAEVIVCPGNEFETAVFDMQKENLSIKYILLDGVPHAQDDTREKLRGNTHAVLFAEEQAGFLAGYAAVKEGYTNLGFMGGIEDSQTMKYGAGFVQGVNEAAKEQGLTADQVSVRYTYTGAVQASPAVSEKAENWYKDGCQVIFSSDAPLVAAVGNAASSQGKLLISTEGSMKVFGGSVLTYVEKDYGTVVYKVLKSIDEKEFGGREKATVGLKEDAVSLNFERSAFHNFTQEQYQAILDKLKNGEVEVSQEDVTKKLSELKIDNITVSVEK